MTTLHGITGSDLLITAVEGGIGHWANVTEYRPDDGYVCIQCDESDAIATVTFTVNADDMILAARKVLEMYPDTRGARYLREGDPDAESADMVMQVACYGEVTFG